MYLMFQYALADQIDHGGVWFYNRHDSGTEGLSVLQGAARIPSRTNVDWSLA
jgi:hypothetical protein